MLDLLSLGQNLLNLCGANMSKPITAAKSPPAYLTLALSNYFRYRGAVSYCLYAEGSFWYVEAKTPVAEAPHLLLKPKKYQAFFVRLPLATWRSRYYWMVTLSSIDPKYKPKEHESHVLYYNKDLSEYGLCQSLSYLQMKTWNTE
jgi:hypothetical protein